jgi:hypothetical protein
MRISAAEEVIFTNLDLLKEAFEPLAEVGPYQESMIDSFIKLYFFDKPPGKVFKTYIKSRKDLVNLLKKNEWCVKDRIEAIKKGVKLCASKYYINVLQDSKEEEMRLRLDKILNLYPQLIDLSRKDLTETEERLTNAEDILEEGPRASRLSRLISRAAGKEIIYKSDIDELNTLKAVLFHPMQRLVSPAYCYNRSEGIAAGEKARIMNDCRKSIFRISKTVLPRKEYKQFTKVYNDLSSLIKINDGQEVFEHGEMNDLILVDSILKNLCPDSPPCYEGAKDPMEFMYRLVNCPTVKDIMPIDPTKRRDLYFKEIMPKIRSKS